MSKRIAKWEHRTRKRLEAQERQKAYSLLSPEFVLERLNRHGYTATKERARLIPLTQRSKAINLKLQETK